MLNIIVSAEEVAAVKKLDSKNSRKQWEESFKNFYINPVLKSLDERLDRAIHLVTTDEKQGTWVLCLTSVLA